MQSSARPNENNDLLFTRLPKEILHLLLSKYLSIDDKQALRLSSKNTYRLLLNIQLSILPSLSPEEQLSVLVKLATRINEEDHNIPLVIKVIRKLAEVSFPNPVVAALALTCLAKFTSLSPTERIQRMLALEVIPPAIKRSLSLDISKKPCTIGELHTLKMTERFLCYSILGITIDIESSGRLIDNVYKIAFHTPVWLVPLQLGLLTQNVLMNSSLLLQPSSLITSVLHVLPLSLEKQSLHRQGYDLEFLLKHLIKLIKPLEADEAWNMIETYLQGLSETEHQARHNIINGSLPLFRRSTMLPKLISLIINDEDTNRKWPHTHCNCVKHWLSLFINHATQEDLLKFTLELMDILNSKFYDEKIWADLILRVHDTALAVNIIKFIFDRLKSRSNNYFPDNYIIKPLIDLLTPELAAELLNDMLDALFGKNPTPVKLLYLTIDIAKRVDRQTASLIIHRLLKTEIALFEKRPAEIILELVKIIDDEGDLILLPLIIQIINPLADLKYSENSRVKDYIYNNLFSITQNTDFDKFPMRNLYSDLNSKQIIKIWSQLHKYFWVSTKIDLICFSHMVKLAYLFPSDRLIDIERFLLHAIERGKFDHSNALKLLHNIRIVNSLSETTVLNILEKIIFLTPLKMDTLLDELLHFIPQFNSQYFNNHIIAILQRMMANNDEQIYERLKNINRDDEAEAKYLAEKIVLISEYSITIIPKLANVFSLLINTKDFEKIIPLLKAFDLMLPTHAITKALICNINLLNPDEVQFLHNQVKIKIQAIDGGWFIQKITHLLSLYLAALNEKQQLDLFNTIYSMQSLSPIHYQFLAKIISACKDSCTMNFYLEQLAKRDGLPIALGHYLSVETLTNLLPPAARSDSLRDPDLDATHLRQFSMFESGINSQTTVSIQLLPQ